MAYFPMFIELQNAPVLVIGGGESSASQGAKAVALRSEYYGGCTKDGRRIGRDFGGCEDPSRI